MSPFQRVGGMKHSPLYPLFSHGPMSAPFELTYVAESLETSPSGRFALKELTYPSAG